MKPSNETINPELEKGKGFYEKVIAQVKEKIVATAIVSMIGIGGTFLWNSGPSLWRLPTLEHRIEGKLNRDSIYGMTVWRNQLMYQDSINKDMDNRISAIRDILIKNRLVNKNYN